MALLLALGACGTEHSDDSATAAEASPTSPESGDDAPAMSADSSSADELAMEPSSGDEPAFQALQQEQADADVSTVSAGKSLSTAITPAGFGRDIIYEATVTVEAPDVAAASRETVDIITELGGFVVGQRTKTEPRPSTEITFKVLPTDFTDALERLADVGELIDQRISTDDVTERIVDLDSRITTTKTSVDRLRTLLEEAIYLDNIVDIEEELLDRETTLETLRGQLRTLQDRVDLATITLMINQSPETLPETGISVKAWAAAGSDDPCKGVRELTVDTDSDVRFCLEVENLGETALTDVEIRSDALRLNVESFEPVQGEFSRVESGRFLVAVLEETMVQGRLAGRVATRGLDIAIAATATPVNSDGTELETVTGESSVSVRAQEDNTRPGFIDSVREGADALASTIGVVLMIVGVLIPFLPIIAAVAFGFWWLLRRRPRGPVPPPSTDESDQHQPSEDRPSEDRPSEDRSPDDSASTGSQEVAE